MSSPPLSLSDASSVSVMEKITDESEDSGVDSIVFDSNVAAKDEEKTIGEGIKFVDPKLLEEEKQRIAEEKIKKHRQEQIEKKLAQEAYEKEIQEKQYKRLMHLLSKSKAFSNFILKKFENELTKDKGKNDPKSKDNDEEKKSGPPPAKRGRVAKSKISNNQSAVKKNKDKLNLSDEEIKEELQAMSDNESVDKENTKKNNSNNFVQPKYFKGDLRYYQKEGLNWLKVLYENGLNGILADEMGLGKTIQIIALFAYLFEKHIQGPYMILVPLSTLPNWISEFERFAPELPVVVYYGSAEKRLELRKQVSKKVHILGQFSTLPIVIMTFEMPLHDHSFLKNFQWRFIVIDEAQRIKNFKSQLFRTVKSFNSYNRILLTGTPLQNNLAELWSLLNFLLPDIFDNLQVFQSWFDAKEVQNEEGRKKFFQQEQEKNVLGALREILQPFMLRRLKEDVCPDVPPLKEVMIYAPLTKIQYDLYSAILNKDINKLHKTKKESTIVDVNGVRPKRKCRDKVNLDNIYVSELNRINQSINTSVDVEKKSSTEDISEWKEVTEVTEENLNYLIRIKMQNTFMMLRHVVNHPYLIHCPMDALMKVDHGIINVSGKLLVLDAMLNKLKAKGHKVLLFSTMQVVLDIIEEYLSLRQHLYVRLDGNIKFDERKEAIHQFQTNPEVFLFLLTTKAGAVGLNLAAADTVIIYDSDWNPQNDLQAMARCHRIGQTRPVAVYRLCTKGTVDEEMIKRASAKRFLEKAVISKEGNLINTEEGLHKLKTLLIENSFKVVDSKNQVYTDAELDEFLDRSDMVLSEKQDNCSSFSESEASR